MPTVSTKNQHVRHLKIHSALKDRQRVNCSSLAKKLGVDRFTILRDIKFMKKRYQLPIIYNSKEKAFEYPEKVKIPQALPVFNLSHSEMRALVMARNLLIQYGGNVMAKNLDSALEKISVFEEVVNSGSSDSMSALVVGAAKTDGRDEENLAIAIRAIDQNRVLKFRYRKANAKKAEWRQTHPHHMVLSKSRWYLLAYCLKEKMIKCYRLDRMSGLEILPQTFLRQPNFNPKDHLNGNMGIIRGKGDYRIKIRFDQLWADTLGETTWGESQKITPLKDGGVEMTMRLTDLWEVTNWLLSCGEHATVIEPKELRDRVAEIAGKLVKLYQTAK